jgi:uncharacterized membrane protein YkoI
MTSRNLLIFALTLCLGVTAAANSATLNSGVVASGVEPTHPTTLQAAGVSLDQAVAMTRAKYNAQVMRANTVDEGGRVVHYIRLMSADRSRVWTVRVDAATGREI